MLTEKQCATRLKKLVKFVCLDLNVTEDELAFFTDEFTEEYLRWNFEVITTRQKGHLQVNRETEERQISLY